MTIRCTLCSHDATYHKLFTDMTCTDSQGPEGERCECPGFSEKGAK